MEDALREQVTALFSKALTVLILVLMEDALRDGSRPKKRSTRCSLNPCSNGRCSARISEVVGSDGAFFVLILVLMEDALRAL